MPGGSVSQPQCDQTGGPGDTRTSLGGEQLGGQRPGAQQVTHVTIGGLSNMVWGKREIKRDHHGVAKLTGANISTSQDMKIQEIKQ